MILSPIRWWLGILFLNAAIILVHGLGFEPDAYTRPFKVPPKTGNITYVLHAGKWWENNPSIWAIPSVHTFFYYPSSSSTSSSSSSGSTVIVNPDGSITIVSACDATVLELWNNDTTIQAYVSNRYTCDCPISTTGSTCQPPYRPDYTYNYLSPFTLEFIDISNEYHHKVLSRRHVSTTDLYLGENPTKRHIPDALDRRLIVKDVVTHVLANITFYEPAWLHYRFTRLQNLFCEDDGSYITDTPIRYSTIKFSNKQWGAGLSIQRQYWCTSITTSCQVKQVWYVKRRAPIPPFYVRIYRQRYEGTPNADSDWTGEMWDSDPTYSTNRPLYQWFETNWTFNSFAKIPTTGEWGQTWMKYVGGMSSSSGGTYNCAPDWVLSIDFQEPVRWYEAMFIVPDIAGVVTQLNEPGKSTILEPVYVTAGIPHSPMNLSIPIQLRIEWTGLKDKHVAANKLLALWIVQPFPMQDLWIEMYDNFGNSTGHRLFLEMEARVPYIVPTSPQQVGWHYALDHGRFNSNWANITVRFNRRAKISSREEDVRARLLVSWVKDRGGNVELTTPIPATVLNEPQVLGAVASRAYTANEDIVTASGINTTFLQYHVAAEWFENTVASMFDADPEWNAFFTRYRVNETKILLRERIVLTLFLLMRASHPVDNSTYFVLQETFYPQQPPNLPIYFDEKIRDRLFGWSEMSRFLSERLANWTEEYNMTARILPYFNATVSLSQYLNMRGWVMRCGFEDAASGHFFIVPIANLFRILPVSNVDLVYQAQPVNLVDEGQWKLRTKTSMSKDTELSLDFKVNAWFKHETFFTFGTVIDQATNGTTWPGYNYYLTMFNETRVPVVKQIMVENALTYVDAVKEFISQGNQRLTAISSPSVIDGMGSPPAVVASVQKLIETEKFVLEFQIKDAQAEYDRLTWKPKDP